MRILSDWPAAMCVRTSFSTELVYVFYFYSSGMKAYSLDLCERVVAACQAGLTQPAVAPQFSVSLSFVAKLLRRQRTSGSVSALAGGRGPGPRLDAAALVQLSACLRQTPDATLDELCTELAASPLASSKPGYVRYKRVPARCWQTPSKPLWTGSVNKTSKIGLTIAGIMYSNLGSALLLVQ